jgi:beta-carotene 3-hydroxylase
MLLNIVLLLVAFISMEGVAWLTHKYIMHGILWHLHRDHHIKEEAGVIEKNDSFFIVFATPAIILFALGAANSWMAPEVWIAAGITCYGLTYFFVHDVYIHQRLKFFRNIDNIYFRAIRRAHKIHHKNTGKTGSVCFGMLWVPYEYIQSAKKSETLK